MEMDETMRRIALILLMAAGTAALSAQTTAKPATHAAHTSRAAVGSSAVKLPAGVPPVKGPVKVAFSLRYQDITIGTGALAEPNKIYKVQYTGWFGANGRADDGHKFDSSYDHREPLLGEDGKPEMGEDGKPKLGPSMPFSFPQGFGRLIPGWDEGFAGMRIGGKRRLFIPWELAYGASGRPGPDAAHPGIPAKSNLIFDVELLDVTDLQMPANHAGTGGAMRMPAGHPAVAIPAPAEHVTPAQPK